MAGRRSNQEGSITYDKRRKRYRARITVGWELNEKTGRAKQITKDIGSSFKTKGEAASALAQYLKNPYDLDNKNITFSELYKIWFEEYMKKHETNRYRIQAAYKYCSLIYDKKFRELTILDMKKCIYDGSIIETKGKNKGEIKYASPSTKESMKTIFNNIYSYAIEARIVEHNYAKDFSLDKDVQKEKEKNKRKKNPFTKEEMNKLWKSIDFVPFSDMIIYACYSGWRASELVDLKIKNVDLQNDFIRGGIKTDAGKNRIVPIHPLVKSIVEKYYKEAMDIGSEFLFNDTTKKKGIGLSYDQYLTRFNNVISLLKFNKTHTPHDTRHTFITKAKSRQVRMDEYILKRVVGHKIKDITEQTYTHRDLEELKEEMFKL